MSDTVRKEDVEVAERHFRKLRVQMNEQETEKKREGQQRRNSRIHAAAEATGLSVGVIGQVIAKLGVEGAVASVDMRDELVERETQAIEEAGNFRLALDSPESAERFAAALRAALEEVGVELTEVGHGLSIEGVVDIDALVGAFIAELKDAK